MTITLDLPDETLSALLFAARVQGRPAAEVAAERLTAWFGLDPIYSTEGSDEETAAIGESLRAVAEGRTRPFDAHAILRRYNLNESIE